MQIKLDQVEEFQKRIAVKLAGVQTSMQEIQLEIEEHLGSQENSDGFLLGNVSDYFDSFDYQIAKFNAMVHNVRRHWNSKKELFEKTYE